MLVSHSPEPWVGVFCQKVMNLLPKSRLSFKESSRWLFRCLELTWKQQERGSTRWSLLQCRSAAERIISLFLCDNKIVHLRQNKDYIESTRHRPYRQVPPSTSFCCECRASASSVSHHHTGEYHCNYYSWVESLPVPPFSLLGDTCRIFI